MFAWFLLRKQIYFVKKVREAECGVSFILPREEAVHMLLEQVYLLFIYILFIELAIVTVVAIALFVAFVVTIRKLDNKKTHLCLVVRDVF